MSPFWKGFLSVFDIGWFMAPKDISRTHVKRLPKIKHNDKQFEWYHEGPWWEHPIYKDSWTKKKDQD